MCHAELKRLETRRNKLRNLLAATVDQLKHEDDKDKRKTLQGEITKIEKELSDIRKNKRSLSEANDQVIVTEHAILRYFERVLGYDIDTIKSYIVPQKTAGQIRELQTGTFPVNNFKLRVKKGTVVTLVTKD